MTTTMLTVTINNVVPQGIQTTVEREVRNNIFNKGDMRIVNKGDVGIEMSKAAGEAGRMAVQLSDRQRREKEKKRKNCEIKAGPVDESAKIASQERTRAEQNCKYQSREHVKEKDAENKRKNTIQKIWRWQ
jgi:hypothetical protein